ncbi:hypothetical protein RLOC_00003686 [Lonchura striata]|uniref:Uncharacterized protein n=1 Tax=Lonchura striata TaxID=40157 RepID=A0A218VDB9_9PASE|nr:hypothetical protein RLOC_00003686 [Lonchura striata domestica]
MGPVPSLLVGTPPKCTTIPPRMAVAPFSSTLPRSPCSE